MRAAHLLMEGDPKVFEDSYALALLDLTEDELRAQHSGYPTAAWVARSRYTEDHLAEATTRGVRQYVLLGAGLDTFVLRAQDWPDLRVFEVDEPQLQSWKRGRLHALGLTPTVDTVYVPCDFERTTAAEALDGAGFDVSVPTFVSWLGVTQYLTTDAIRSTLEWTAGLAPGSAMALTHVLPSAKDDAAVQLARSMGSSFDTFLTTTEIDALCEEAGLSIADHPTTEDLQDRYFENRTDGLRASHMELCALAVVA